jgi:hypothetical protein
MSNLEPDQQIQRYLGAVESGLILSDEAAQKRLDEDSAKALAHIENAQEHLDEEAHHEVDLLRTALDELRVQYALGKMEGAEKLTEIEERIEHGYQNLKNAVRRAKNLTKQESEELNDALHQGWRNLKLGINILYLRLSLAHDSGNDRLAAAKEELIQDVKFLAKLGKDEAELIGDNCSLWCKKVEKSVRQSALKLVRSMEKYLLDSGS